VHDVGTNTENFENPKQSGRENVRGAFGARQDTVWPGDQNGSLLHQPSVKVTPGGNEHFQRANGSQQWWWI